jgi:ABC-type lipoprotein export system ATPase subunit
MSNPSGSLEAHSNPAESSATAEGDEGLPVIRAENVERIFEIGANRIEVLRGVSLQVMKGERLFLCGASGAGKTSLLYTLAGLEKPNSGEVFLGERSLYRLGRREQARIRNRDMGYVFQNYALLPELTAMENVIIPARIQGLEQHHEKRANELLDMVGLGQRLHHLPTELSGGEQQRVAIARSLINNPAIIFADEPTGNLDSATGDEIMRLLLDLVSREGKTLIVVTHDARLAQTGDRRLELADGKLVS